MRLPGIGLAPGSIAPREHTARLRDLVAGRLGMEQMRRLLREKGDPTDAFYRDLVVSVEVAYERYTSSLLLARATVLACGKLLAFRRSVRKAVEAHFALRFGGQAVAEASLHPEETFEELLRCSMLLMRQWQHEQREEERALSDAWQRCSFAALDGAPSSQMFASKQSRDGLRQWKEMLPRLLELRACKNKPRDCRFEALLTRYSCYTYFLALGRLLQQSFRWPGRIFDVAEHV